MKKALYGLLVLCAVAAAAAAQEPQATAPPGPTELIITYRCPPPRRAAFRQYMTEFGISRFEHWKQDGVLKDYRFLFNWYVDVDTWDAMAVLTFPAYAQVVRWKDIEKVNPGGLARDALDLAWPLNTYSADLVTSGDSGQPRNTRQTVYYVTAYDVAGGADFRDFANANLIPQAKASIRDAILTSYSVYSNRYPGGKRWQGLLVLEYKDADALARRPRMKSFQGTVTEREAVIADPMLPR